MAGRSSNNSSGGGKRQANNSSGGGKRQANNSSGGGKRQNLDEMQGNESQRPANFSNKMKVFFPTDIRIIAIIIVFVLLLLLLFGKLFWMQVIDVEENVQNAIDTRTISYKTTPKRGTIFDRNGNVLAYSDTATTIYANPREVENKQQAASEIASALGGSSSDYSEILEKDTTFAYIKRKADVDKASKLQEKEIAGIYFVEDSKRVYPYGKTAGQIVGACNIDGVGLCGMELYYDEVLSGSGGRTIAQQGKDGMPIPGGIVEQTSAIDGQDIMLTIDIETQAKVEELITQYNTKQGAKSTHSIVADPATGEIYAAASLPLFDPSSVGSTEEGATDIKCISSTYEPGSTFKTVSAMAVLENDVFKPEETIYCPNSIKADEYEVSDAHQRGAATWSFSEIIARSSNVGISLITEKLGNQKLYEKIVRYLLNEPAGVDFPGDTSGYLADWQDWSKIQAYNISFGQGVTVTPMTLLKFYSALCCDGLEPTPHFLLRYLQSDKDEEYARTDVVDNKTVLPTINSMLRGVVDQSYGTGKLASMSGYGVAGKTGTGEIADKNGKYISGKYYISFIGYFTTTSHNMICQTGAEYVPSETNSTALWKDIMTFVADRFRIIPTG